MSKYGCPLCPVLQRGEVFAGSEAGFRRHELQKQYPKIKIILPTNWLYFLKSGQLETSKFCLGLITWKLKGSLRTRERESCFIYSMYNSKMLYIDSVK